MVVKIPLLKAGDGGVYFISPSKSSQIRKWKVGMSHNSLLKRINSYGICYTQVHVACIIKVKRQNKRDKPSYARTVESFMQDVLTRMGYFQQYAVIGTNDGKDVNFVTRSKGEYFGEFDRDTINEIVQSVWPWLESLGATVAYDPQAIVNYDDEGGIARLVVPKKPQIIAAIVPNERPLSARVLRSMDPLVTIETRLKRPKARPKLRRPPPNPKEAALVEKRRTRRSGRRVRRPKRFRE